MPFSTICDVAQQPSVIALSVDCYESDFLGKSICLHIKVSYNLMSKPTTLCDYAFPVYVAP